LRRLIVNQLALKSPAALRLGHLDLLFQLVMAFPDLIITDELYERERAHRAQLGEEFPSARAVGERYGGWLGALRVAERFRDVGGPARVKSSHLDIKKAQAAQKALRQTGGQPGYQPELIRQAIIACANDLRDWPTEWEFHAWAKLARARGMRVPYARHIRKAFDSYANAVRVTRDSYELAGRGLG
jgi:hypothetical protein